MSVIGSVSAIPGLARAAARSGRGVTPDPPFCRAVALCLTTPLARSWRAREDSRRDRYEGEPGRPVRSGPMPPPTLGARRLVTALPGLGGAPVPHGRRRAECRATAVLTRM